MLNYLYLPFVFVPKASICVKGIIFKQVMDSNTMSVSSMHSCFSSKVGQCGSIEC